jgi:integration host factor subunit alpha
MTMAESKPNTAVTRVDLIEAVYRGVGLSRAESARLVDLVLREITDCLERGETVKLFSFGSFVVRTEARPEPEDRGRGADTPAEGDSVQGVRRPPGEAPGGSWGCR